jgi:hypothetical protein
MRVIFAHSLSGVQWFYLRPASSIKRGARDERPATLNPDEQEEELHAPVQPPTAVQLPGQDRIHR